MTIDLAEYHFLRALRIERTHLVQTLYPSGRLVWTWDHHDCASAARSALDLAIWIEQQGWTSTDTRLPAS